MNNKYECEDCNYETSRRANLTRHFKSKKHLRNIGEIDVYHYCDIADCEYKSKRKWNVKKHKESHSSVIIHKFYCKACCMSFRDRANTMVHLRSKPHKTRLQESYYPEAFVTKEIGSIEMVTGRIDKSKWNLYLFKCNKKVSRRTKPMDGKEEEVNQNEPREPEAKTLLHPQGDMLLAARDLPSLTVDQLEQWEYFEGEEKLNEARQLLRDMMDWVALKKVVCDGYDGDSVKKRWNKADLYETNEIIDGLLMSVLNRMYDDELKGIMY